MKNPLILLAASLSIGLASAATVQQFQPQGKIAGQTRVTARFSADMIKLGDLAAGAPFAVDCEKIPGESRWIDTRTWAWQLARPLQPGEKCIFSVKAGYTSPSGETLAGNTRFEMQGAAPRPWRIVPPPGSEIEEDQAFAINGGSALDRKSVDQNLWCEADSVGHRIPARMVDESIRRKVLSEFTDLGEAAIVVTCSERLPTGSRAKLVWGKGIKSANGTATEKEESFPYKIRPPFEARLHCERENSAGSCSPLSELRLDFTAPFDARLLKRFSLITPDGKRTPTDPNGQSSYKEPSLSSLSFPGPFPQNAVLRLELPAGIVDQNGRPLVNADKFPLTIHTASLPPLAKFPGNFGILELKEGGLLPVTLRNVEATLKKASLSLPGRHRFSNQRLTEDADVIAAMLALEHFENQSRQFKARIAGEMREVYDPYFARELSFLDGRQGVVHQDLPKPGGSSEFEVLGIPLRQPGYHIVEIKSEKLGESLLFTPKPMYVRAAALVTNLAVHLKTGRENALVWVTALDDGKPVANADVRVSNCSAMLWQGKTDKFGRAMIDRPLDTRGCPFLFASARLDGDYSFVRSDWNAGIEPWRFGVMNWEAPGDLKIHGILDRSLFRPGQTLSIKHVARSRGKNGFMFPKPGSLPDKLIIRHRESGTEYSQALVWDTQASATSTWKVPESAKLGTYEIIATGGKQAEQNVGEFRVSDFRLPVFTGSVQGVPARQIAPSRVPLALALSYLNGGAAKNAEVQVSATQRSRWVSFKGYEDYNFNVSSADNELEAFRIEGNHEAEKLILDRREIRLDKDGAAKLDVPLVGARLNLTTCAR